MKRIALAGLFLSLAAGSALAQSGAEYGSFSNHQHNSGSVILKGVGADGQANSLVSLMGEEAAGGKAEIGQCEGCHEDYTECCCGPCWKVFGEYLFLQPRGADTVFAVLSTPCVQPGAPTLPLGPAEQLDFDFESGFKVGFAKMLTECSEITVSFTHFESEDSETVVVIPPNVLRPLLLHPATLSCDLANATRATASGGIDFDRADIDYRSYSTWGCFTFDWLAGFGYGQLNQDLRAAFDTSTVDVNADVWGYGIRLGGGAEYDLSCIRGFVRSELTLLAANVEADFHQRDRTGVTNFNADYSQDFDRIVPVLDLQLGVAKDITCHTTLKVGYTYSFWFNVPTVPGWIHDVQKSNFNSISGDTLSFDGLFVRLETAW